MVWHESEKTKTRTLTGEGEVCFFRDVSWEFFYGRRRSLFVQFSSVGLYFDFPRVKKSMSSSSVFVLFFLADQNLGTQWLAFLVSRERWVVYTVGRDISVEIVVGEQLMSCLSRSRCWCWERRVQQ